MSAPPPRPVPQAPTLEIPPDLEAIYINLVRIAHSPSELVLEFAHILPGSPVAKVRSRVIMSPLGAKLLHRALSENLARFETSFGEIKIPGETSLADFLFRGHPPEPPKPTEPPKPPEPPKE